MTNAERCRAYYQAHRAERIAKVQAYYAAHRDEKLTYAKQYQRDHLTEHREATTRHRKKDPAATRAYHRAYYKAHAEELRPRKAAEARASGRRQRDDPRKRAARAAVDTALRQGLLTKPTRCSQCGMVAPSRRMHAHHADYSQPLEVRWLCSWCHQGEHRTKGES